MLQIRLKEGGNRQWFNPARDIVNIMPGLVKTALLSFDEFEGDDKCSKDELVVTAGELAKLFKLTIETPVDAVEAHRQYEQIKADHPVALSMISDKFMRVLTGIFATWVSDAKPKTEGDAEIPTYGMDAIVEYLLADHVYTACECGSTRFMVNNRPKGLLLCDSCGKPVRRVKADGPERDA